MLLLHEQAFVPALHERVTLSGTMGVEMTKALNMVHKLHTPKFEAFTSLCCADDVTSVLHSLGTNTSSSNLMCVRRTAVHTV
jgi:hypothetical protein